MKTKFIFFLLTLCCISAAQAKLTVTVDSTKQVGKKSVIKLTLKNDFQEKVESARAQIFLIDEQGKVVGQKAQWVIGGTKDRPVLDPGATTTYNFVVDANKPFNKTKVGFTRIILEGGKVADVPKSFEVIQK
jgi:hypothetical protein